MIDPKNPILIVKGPALNPNNNNDNSIPLKEISWIPQHAL